VLDVADHPLVLALCAGPIGTTRPWYEAVETGKVQEAIVEPYHLSDSVSDDGAFLIVDEYLIGDTTEVLERTNDDVG
jgi:hypothetical protein